VKPRAPAIVLIACLAGGWVTAREILDQAKSPQTFRTATDVVLVDASVRRGNTPVAGLTAADFELRDNGVVQQIESVEVSAVPIDLTIIVDVSGNPDRPWVELPPATKVAADVEARARPLTRLLRDGDRARLLAIDSYVQQPWPLQDPASLGSIRRLDFDGNAALYNALAAALLQPVDLNRRHVIVASTRGLDSTSTITAAQLRAIAERSDAQLHLVMEEVDADAEVTVRGFQCVNMGLCRPTVRFWVPARRRLFNAIPLQSSAARILYPDGLELKAGAGATGGALYQGVLISEPTLQGTFASAFQNFRQSYVLRYTPRGVDRPGWHRITVSVPKDRSLRIRARSGYAVDPPAAVAPVSRGVSAETTPADLRTVADFTTAYERGAFDVVAAALRRYASPNRLIADFDRGSNPWPTMPRREAAFVLELAEAGIFSPNDAARDEAVRLLERFAILVRHPIEPDDFERAWLTAVVTMLQGTIRPATTLPFVERALLRYPGDARLLLARAIVLDQQWPLSGGVTAGPAPARMAATPEHVAAVSVAYEAASAHDAVRAEALVRWAWLLQRIGRTDDAMGKLREAANAATADAPLNYLRELLIGRVHQSRDRQDEAVAAYRRALAIAPGGTAARVGLMNALLQLGQRVEAESIAEALQAAPPPIVDPWWQYWQGSYRRYPEVLRALREMGR
jgi:VWFA-related protein